MLGLGVLQAGVVVPRVWERPFRVLWWSEGLPAATAVAAAAAAFVVRAVSGSLASCVLYVLRCTGSRCACQDTPREMLNCCCSHSCCGAYTFNGLTI